MALDLSQAEKDIDDTIFKKNASDEESQTRRGSRVTEVHDPERATVGKQLELEAENAIKYRTCSWQKVSHSSGSFLFSKAD
jgi:hypothetical protein